MYLLTWGRNWNETVMDNDENETAKEENKKSRTISVWNLSKKVRDDEFERVSLRVWTRRRKCCQLKIEKWQHCLKQIVEMSHRSSLRIRFHEERGSVEKFWNNFARRDGEENKSLNLKQSRRIEENIKKNANTEVADHPQHQRTNHLQLKASPEKAETSQEAFTLKCES